MLGKAHISIGTAAGLSIALAVARNPDELLWMASIGGFVGAVGGGLPDVLDSEHAAGRRLLMLSWSGIRSDARRMFRHKGAGALAILYEAPLLLVRVVLAIIVDIIAGLLPHRGVTHWGLTWFLLSVLAVLVSILAGWVWVYAAAFSAGYLLHLLGDAMTESGVRLLAPLHNRPIHIIPKMFAFNYDSPIQWAVVVMVWGMALILLRSQGWLGQVAALVEGIR